MQRGVEQAEQRARDQQADAERLGTLGQEAHRAGQGHEHRRPEAQDHERRSRSEPIDEPPARQHGERVEQQERGVDQPHPLLIDALGGDDPLGAGDRHAHAVEVRHRHHEHQERDRRQQGGTVGCPTSGTVASRAVWLKRGPSAVGVDIERFESSSTVRPGMERDKWPSPFASRIASTARHAEMTQDVVQEAGPLRIACQGRAGVDRAGVKDAPAAGPLPVDHLGGDGDRRVPCRAAPAAGSSPRRNAIFRAVGESLGQQRDPGGILGGLRSAAREVDRPGTSRSSRPATSPSWPIGCGSGCPGVPPNASPSRSFRSLGWRNRKWSGFADLVGSDARAHRRRPARSTRARIAARRGSRTRATSRRAGRRDCATSRRGGRRGPGSRRVSLAALDDARVHIERHPPERRVPREHDRVAAPVEKPAYVLHRLERPVFAVPDDEQHLVAVQDMRVEVQVGVAQDVVIIPLRFRARPG